MRTNYISIAAPSLERLAALSDGIFAVAMTLLVLDLRVPASGPVHSEQGLWEALVTLSPRLLTYFMSFMTLGIFWVAQHTQFGQYQRSDRNFAWIHLVFLLAVSLMPFSTGLLAEFITYRLALVIYWLNLLLLGVMLYISLGYAWRAGLITPEASPEARAAQVRRIILYQVLYAVGTLLCIINTYVSIVFIVLLQLNSAIAPRIRPLDRF